MACLRAIEESSEESTKIPGTPRRTPENFCWRSSASLSAIFSLFNSCFPSSEVTFASNAERFTLRLGAALGAALAARAAAPAARAVCRANMAATAISHWRPTEAFPAVLGARRDRLRPSKLVVVLQGVLVSL